MLEESVRRNDRPIIENKAKFVLVKAADGHKHSLEEMFSDPATMASMAETKFSKEVEILNSFMRLMETDPERAYYGYQHVSRANEELAIQSLLVTDQLFRSSSIKTRKLYVQLVESVRENGGQVFIFSSMHVSGQQLQQVSGVAAILRYPLPDLDELELQAEEWEEQNGGESSDEEYDPLERVREDVEDMGF